MNLNLMDPKLIAYTVAALLVIVVAVALYVRKRKHTTAELRQRFGPEYDRVVRQHGSERKAEAKLADRETRVEMLKIRDLDLAEREGYLSRWQAVQSRFVDYPKGAVTEADELVCSLMQTRGYPVTDFDQRAADVALRLGRGEASTEDLRTAMIHYRSLFDELVQAQTSTDKRVA
jgi:hypothetical protein